MVSKFLKSFDISNDFWAIIIGIIFIGFFIIYLNTEDEYAKDFALQFSGAFISLVVPGAYRSIAQNPNYRN